MALAPLLVKREIEWWNFAGIAAAQQVLLCRVDAFRLPALRNAAFFIFGQTVEV